MRRALLATACLALAGTPAWSGTFRYSGGPEAPADTALSVAVPELTPIVRARGPRVPLTNLQLATLVAEAAVESGLKDAPLGTAPLVVAPAGEHPLNFVIEHGVLRELAHRNLAVSLRRAQVVDDSALTVSHPGELLLDYQVASARVTYIRLRGWLPGRVQIERQALVEVRFTLRDPRTSKVQWSGEATHNLVDAFPRGAVTLVEDPRYAELKSEVPGRSVDKAVEPVIVVAIVGGLIALFFQNRP